MRISVFYFKIYVCYFLAYIGQGQNPARQASVDAGVPFETTATSVNMLCGSGMKAVALGWQAIKCNDAKIVIAGGQESMSQVITNNCYSTTCVKLTV